MMLALWGALLTQHAPPTAEPVVVPTPPAATSSPLAPEPGAARIRAWQPALFVAFGPAFAWAPDRWTVVPHFSFDLAVRHERRGLAPTLGLSAVAFVVRRATPDRFTDPLLVHAGVAAVADEGLFARLSAGPAAVWRSTTLGASKGHAWGWGAEIELGTRWHERFGQSLRLSYARVDGENWWWLSVPIRFSQFGR